MFFLIISEFLLFAAFILLLLVSISAPIIDNIGFLNVRPGNQIYRFGAWGMCQTTGQNMCSKSKFGYDLQSYLTQLAHGGVAVHSSLRHSTKANILVPIACGITFIAMLIAWTSNKFGFFFASAIAVLAFITSLAAMVADFVIYGIAKKDMHNSGIKADYGAGMWMLLGATIALLLASVTALFQCCCGHRRHRDRDDHHGRLSTRIKA